MIDLDKRILDGKKPLTAFDEVDSKFIGTECYFSDDASNFMNVVLNCQKGRLLSIGEITGLFKATIKNSYEVFHYCLPTEWVKTEPEKKYRPYKDVEEFFDDVGCTLGDVIRFRKKGSFEEEYHTLLTGFKGNARVNIGLEDGGYYSLSDLFILFELYTSDGWKPFGIEE